MKEPAAPRPCLAPVKLWPFVLTLGVGLLLWYTPPPEGITNPRAWQLLAIFVATIVGLISKPLPMGAVPLFSVLAIALLGVLPVEAALAGFSSRTVWLIVGAFFIARGFIKTGLGARIGYQLIRLLGRRSLGLAYGLAATDLLLAPAMPSNTARAAGVVYPLVLAVARAFDSHPDEASRRRIGAFLMLNSFHAVLITGALFLTGMAGNLMAQDLAAKQGITITWSDWALAACVPGLLSFLLIPFLLYLLYPPEIRRTPEATELARQCLQALGPMSAAEWVVLGVFLGLLVLWVFGPWWNLDATTVALTGVGLLLLSGVLTWDDVLSERGAWDTLVWFSSVLMMADGLNRLGLIGWFSGMVAGRLTGVDWKLAFPILVVVYYYSHYLLAGNTAHVSAMYAPFLAVALVAGTPPLLAALVLGFVGNLFSSTTHYGTGPSPVFFGAGYVPIGVWWGLGAVISVAHFLIWGVVGGLWWKVIGLW